MNVEIAVLVNESKITIDCMRKQQFHWTSTALSLLILILILFSVMLMPNVHFVIEN